MDSTEEKACLACGGTVVDGVCVKCGTKTGDSPAAAEDAELHGGVIAEETPAMSAQTMGEDLSAPEPEHTA